jgi:aspartate 1-decarboxylase
MLKSKIHHATVTQASPDAEDGVTIDADLLEAASILPLEQVHIVDLTNGTQLQTYAIEGERGSGTVCLNGASSKLVGAGDVVSFATYDQVAEPEAHGWRPVIIYVDEKNQITRVAHDIPTAAR